MRQPTAFERGPARLGRALLSPGVRRYGPRPVTGLVHSSTVGSALVALLLVACSGSDAETTPADVLSHFLDAMDRSTVNDSALADAYALLDSGARRELRSRADQAALVAGHDFEPWQMLAQGRFRLRFSPAEHGGMRAKISGQNAVVHVVSDDRRSQVDVPMVREAGQWHVKLEIPAVRPVSKAEGEAPAP